VSSALVAATMATLQSTVPADQKARIAEKQGRSLSVIMSAGRFDKNRLAA